MVMVRQSKGSFNDWFRSLLLVDLIIGLATTFKYLFRKKWTTPYPEKKLEPTDRFRGLFKFYPDICIVCELCAKACPIDIIYINYHREEDEKGRKKKVLDSFDIDVKRCMFCGLCEDACPTKPKSIILTTQAYEGAVYDRKELYFDTEKLATFVENLKKEAGEEEE